MAVLDINAKFVAVANPEDNDSKKTMLYTADSGEKFAVKISENIGELLGFDDYTTSSTEGEKPASLRMRTVSFSDESGKVKGQYPVGKPSEPIYTIGGTITVARKGSATGVVCQVLGAQGEKRKLFGGNDTGQQDGDNT